MSAGKDLARGHTVSTDGTVVAVIRQLLRCRGGVSIPVRKQNRVYQSLLTDMNNTEPNPVKATTPTMLACFSRLGGRFDDWKSFCGGY